MKKKEKAGQKSLCRKCKTVYRSADGSGCPVCSGVVRNQESIVNEPLEGVAEVILDAAEEDKGD